MSNPTTRVCDYVSGVETNWFLTEDPATDRHWLYLLDGAQNMTEIWQSSYRKGRCDGGQRVESIGDLLQRAAFPVV